MKVFDIEIKNLSIEEYADKIKTSLKDIIIDLQKSDTSINNRN